MMKLNRTWVMQLINYHLSQITAKFEGDFHIYAPMKTRTIDCKYIFMINNFVQDDVNIHILVQHLELETSILWKVVWTWSLMYILLCVLNLALCRTIHKMSHILLIRQMKLYQFLFLLHLFVFSNSFLAIYKLIHKKLN